MMRPPRSLALPSVALAPLAVLYGFAATFLFRTQTEDLLSTMTLCFIFLLPVAIGALTVSLSPRQHRTSWVYGIGAPWIPVGLLGLVAMLLAWEAAICIVMAIPAFGLMASIGGALLTWIYRRRGEGGEEPTTLVGALLFLPFLLAPVEGLIPLADSIRTVESQIVIDAPPERVWAQLTSVPEIRPEERADSLFPLLGLPLPVEAMLDYEGVGGVRHARYSNGLALVEPVTLWEPPHRFRFSVELDPELPPPVPFGEVGGRYFEVREVGYTLEPLEGGRTRLRLQSTHRLSTHFNFYGGPWTDFLMRDLQQQILHVLHQRADGARALQ